MSIESDLKKLRPTMSKSDKARYLLDLGHSATEISKAVPMAYSQVHSIRKKMPGRLPDTEANSRKAVPEVRIVRQPSAWDQSAKAPGKRTTKPVTSPVLDRIKKGKPVDIGRITGRVGKLRTPGLPSDTDVGECANCGYGLVVRGSKVGLLLIHVGMSAEEYLSVGQFCQAVPKVLLA